MASASRSSAASSSAAAVRTNSIVISLSSMPQEADGAGRRPAEPARRTAAVFVELGGADDSLRVFRPVDHFRAMRLIAAAGEAEHEALGLIAHQVEDLGADRVVRPARGEAPD